MNKIFDTWRTPVLLGGQLVSSVDNFVAGRCVDDNYNICLPACSKKLLIHSLYCPCL